MNAEQPDVVLMDIRMPRLDGLEATRRMLGRGDPVRVLIMTTFDLDEYVYEALRAGASGFLLKDIGRDDLARGGANGRGRRRVARSDGDSPADRCLRPARSDRLEPSRRRWSR